jgi:hypothetical protein
VVAHRLIANQFDRAYNSAMLRRFRPDTLRAILLALLLVGAQLLLAQHQADLAQHAANDHCEFCLTHSPLAGGLPVAALPVAASTGNEAPPPVSSSTFFSVSFAPYGARAPPPNLPV